jgi:hypothetical protein
MSLTALDVSPVSSLLSGPMGKVQCPLRRRPGSSQQQK